MQARLDDLAHGPEAGHRRASKDRVVDLDVATMLHFALVEPCGEDMFQIKRAYEPPAPEDGLRVLVDRLWPRGLSKEAAAIDEWLKDIAPSAQLRTWFGHDPERWAEFKARYREELRSAKSSAALERLRDAARTRGSVTLLFAARDTTHNHASVLLEVLNEQP